VNAVQILLVFVALVAFAVVAVGWRFFKRETALAVTMLAGLVSLLVGIELHAWNQESALVRAVRRSLEAEANQMDNLDNAIRDPYLEWIQRNLELAQPATPTESALEQAQRELGTYLYRSGRAREARVAFAGSRQLADSAAAKNNLALAYIAEGALGEGESLLERAAAGGDVVAATNLEIVKAKRFDLMMMAKLRPASMP
jgi:hypothetical protein